MNSQKKSTPASLLFRWFQNSFLMAVYGLLIAIFLVTVWYVYIPQSFGQSGPTIYKAQKGMGDEDIAKELKSLGIIKNPIFFEFYVIASGQHGKLQAGTYELSPSMSTASIVKKFVKGDTIKEKVTIIEGWNMKEIAQYLESRKLLPIEDFFGATLEDWSDDFSFLKERPVSAGAGLEGYLFPDTYEISDQGSKELNSKELVKIILSNFDKKLTPELRQEIKKQNKSIFKIVTMASIIEKEVRSIEDKMVVSGILWKRIAEGIPLQVDATVNYVTGKNDSAVTIEDSKIDSHYNTYKYYGLPLGPISNPGLDSILAAIYPKESSYWYYLSANGDGRTVFSETLEKHNIAKSKYLK